MCFATEKREKESGSTQEKIPIAKIILFGSMSITKDSGL